MKQKKNMVVFRTQDGRLSLQVSIDAEQDTVWLNLSQIANLFQRDKSAISRHIHKIFSEQELKEKQTVAYFATVQKEGPRPVKRTIAHYNLDVILSVGYRVNSKRGVEFRRWTSHILKQYLLQGYALNKKQLTYVRIREIDRTLDLLKNTLMIHHHVDDIGLAALDIIRMYTKTWHTLRVFDEKILENTDRSHTHVHLDYQQACEGIAHLKKQLSAQKEATAFFGKETEQKLYDILGNIAQSFEGKYLYPSLYEQGAHLFYFIIKDHPFVDGNKRIASFLLLLFLSMNGVELHKLSNETIISMALLTAQSIPQDKELMIKLIGTLLQ